MNFDFNTKFDYPEFPRINKVKIKQFLSDSKLWLLNPLTIKSKLMDFLKNKTSTTLKKSLMKTNNFNDLLMALVPVATREKIRKNKSCLECG